MDSIVHGVTKSRTQLSDFHFLKRILFINGFSLFIWLLRKLNRLFYVASQSFSINTPKEWLFSILHTYLNHLGSISENKMPRVTLGILSVLILKGPGCTNFVKPLVDPWEGNGNPLHCSCMENPMDRGAWQATVHGVAKNGKWLSD